MLATVQLSWLLYTHVTHSWRENRRSCLTHCGWGGIVLVRASVYIAGWSSLVARRAHNPKVVGSNPAPATIRISSPPSAGFLLAIIRGWESRFGQLSQQGRQIVFMHKIVSPQENGPLRIKSKFQQTLQPKFKTLVMIVRIQQALILWSSSRQLLNQCICCLPH